MRGEVWWCELPDVGRRPVVVLSRDVAIPRLRRALIGPCTTTVRGIPTEVHLEPAEDPIPRASVGSATKACGGCARRWRSRSPAKLDLLRYCVSASAPATTSRISCVISAWRARFICSVSESMSSPAFFDALRMAVMRAPCSDAADSSSAR
jgi:PemK-like, MazF-like toxin of type II toxin-antitoxin system